MKKLTITEYATKFNIQHRATVFKQIKSGKLKGEKINNIWYIFVDDETKEKREEQNNFNDNQALSILEKRINELEDERNKRDDRIERLEQDLRNKDKIIHDSLQVIQTSINSKHDEMLLALQNIGAGQVTNVGLLKGMGHFDSKNEDKYEEKEDGEVVIEEAKKKKKKGTKQKSNKKKKESKKDRNKNRKGKKKKKK